MQHWIAWIDCLSADDPRLQSGPRPFTGLGPEQVLDALESTGLECDGRLQALNSFENRVYLVGLEGGASRVAKFYRPGRWTDAQIREEHAFAAELAEAEIPVVAPLAASHGDTLIEAGGFRVAIYPRQGGRVPELDNARHGPEMRNRIGQFIARIHNVGARAAFQHRPALDPTSHAIEPIAIIRASGMLPPELEASWRAVADQCAHLVTERFNDVASVPRLRVHGDCHLGNLLWTDDGPHFVDLDDCRTAPAIQDLWMLADAGAALTQDTDEPGARSTEMAEMMEGYERMRELDRREISLIEPLRTLRMLHYCAWLTQRWDDPAFPAAFPWFGSTRYWQDQILHLREQLGRLQG